MEVEGNEEKPNLAILVLGCGVRTTNPSRPCWKPLVWEWRKCGGGSTYLHHAGSTRPFGGVHLQHDADHPLRGHEACLDLVRRLEHAELAPHLLK